MIVWFFLQGFFTFCIFIIYISNGHLSGGEIGITPMSVGIATSIQFLSSIALFFLLKKFLIDSKRIIFFLINIVVYQLAYLIFSDGMPIFNMNEGGLRGYLDKGYTLSSILAGVFIIAVYYFYQLVIKARR